MVSLMANDACLCKPVAVRLRVPDLLARPVCPPAVLTGKQDEKLDYRPGEAAGTQGDHRTSVRICVLRSVLLGRSLHQPGRTEEGI